MQKSNISWGKKKLAMALSSPWGNLPTDREQMVLYLDTICFSVVINIGSRGGLNFIIALLAIPVDFWGILNLMCLLECETWVGFLWMGNSSNETREKKETRLISKLFLCDSFHIMWPPKIQSKRGISLLIFSSVFIKTKYE